MRLYLVQHGQAKSADVDPDRHLTETGQQDVEKMHGFLQPMNLRVNDIWHSGKVRAAETAEILSPAISATHGLIQRQGLAPNDPVESVKEELVRRVDDLMIVGHLPFLSRLVSALLVGNESQDIVTFQQGGIVCLERREHAIWTISWMVTSELIP